MTEPVVLAVAEVLAGADDEPAEWYIDTAQYLYDKGLLTNAPVVVKDAGSGTYEWSIEK